MTMETKNDIFQEHLANYLTANKAGKGKLLAHVCFVTGMHRKAAVRKFGRLQLSSSALTEARGRPLYYTPDVTLALKDIWEAASEICGELVHPVIAEYVAIFQRDGQWKHGEEVTAKLLTMSEGTVKLRVGQFMAGKQPSRGLSGTKPGQLKEIIPIFTGPWADKPPGYGQLDTVVHCGSSLVGNMAFTVNWTDVATLWGGRRAQWNKGQVATQKSLSAIKRKLPFVMLGAHPDTGSEFINWHLKGWCDEQGVELTRSRPYHKDDNAYVEQKNGHVVRRFLGYQRLDCREVVDVMNELYEVLDLYLNHFVPSRKCLEKVRIGSKYKKRYDKGKSPYRRVIEHPDITDEVKAALKAEHEGLNPLLLSREVARLSAAVFKKQREGERLR
jgi:hypothetical protein